MTHFSINNSFNVSYLVKIFSNHKQSPWKRQQTKSIKVKVQMLMLMKKDDDICIYIKSK